ncbi:hypothetical protein NPIL_216031 [Nephila pilipes]|uniref:Uncharacterized protein n=1 Tax=Nephila pilipes TaxID=299642 RepID=A0A8X6NFD8_NEPPI|nr:hypothetical protein NPIL_216031 [Nephila pilipes]
MVSLIKRSQAGQRSSYPIVHIAKEKRDSWTVMDDAITEREGRKRNTRTLNHVFKQSPKCVVAARGLTGNGLSLFICGANEVVEV